MPTYKLKVVRLVQQTETAVISITADSPEGAKKLALQTPPAFLSTVSKGFLPIRIDEAYGIQRVFTEDDQADYVGHGGSRCPVCDSQFIELTESAGYNKTATSVKVLCTDCNSTWVNHYRLAEFAEVKEPKHG